MKKDFVQRICAILVKNNVITHEDAQAMAKTFEGVEKARFDTFLLEQGLVSRQNLLNALSEYYQVPAFDCTGYFFEREELHKFPKDYLLRSVIIPVERDENMYTVVASQPDEPSLLSGIGNYVSYDIRFMVGLEQDITDAVKEFYDKAPTEIDEDEDLREEREEWDEVRKIEEE